MVNRLHEYDNRNTAETSHSLNTIHPNSSSLNPAVNAPITTNATVDQTQPNSAQTASNQSQHGNRNHRINIDLKGSGGARSSTSLSSALVAPPPPPPPPEGSSQDPAQLSQAQGAHFSHPNPAYYNRPMSAVNSQQPLGTGFDQGGSNQFNGMQQNAGVGAFGNFGNPPVGMGPGFADFTLGNSGYNGGGFRGGIGANPAGMGGPNITRPYMNNMMFPNQNQGPPRYW